VEQIDLDAIDETEPQLDELMQYKRDEEDQPHTDPQTIEANIQPSPESQ
jgi:hypothetical protein